MNPALREVSEHIRELGLGALAHANRHAAYAAMANPSWPELSVLQAAHAAELLIKARIAQEHPLLIFDQLPKMSQSSGNLLDLEDLFKSGRSVQWQDLPERLWATTGLELPNREIFDAFGRLRNGIQHFASIPEFDNGGAALKFIFEVIDPFINICWGLYAIDYDEDYDPYICFVCALVSRKIRFLVSPEAAERFDEWEVDWAEADPLYRAEMFARVEEVREKREKK